VGTAGPGNPTAPGGLAIEFMLAGFLAPSAAATCRNADDISNRGRRTHTFGESG
jgi:hypothetical protein